MPPIRTTTRAEFDAMLADLERRSVAAQVRVDAATHALRARMVLDRLGDLVPELTDALEAQDTDTARDLAASVATVLGEARTLVGAVRRWADYTDQVATEMAPREAAV